VLHSHPVEKAQNKKCSSQESDRSALSHWWNSIRHQRPQP
jgi:hypothetical protein